MLGVTEAKAKEIFDELWHNDEFEWDFEREHFLAQCNRYGMELMLDAKYDLLKARQGNKQIANEMSFLFGCARMIQEREQSRKQGSRSRGIKDETGLTPKGFNAYADYYDYLCRKIQEDFPDTPEQAERRRQEWEAYRERKREAQG